MSASPRYAAVIFDMDGVIVDTEALYLDMEREFSREFGLGVTDEELRAQVGCSHQTFQATIAGWFARAGKPRVAPELAVRFFDDWYADKPKDFAALLNPGVTETLGALHAAGVRVALASSSTLENIELVLGDCGLIGEFEAIVSGEQFRESKPNPEIYLHTVERLGLTPHACCCVEDSVPGIAAGKAAGLTVFARHEDRFGFSQDAADVIVDKVSGILPYVLGA